MSLIISLKVIRQIREKECKTKLKLEWRNLKKWELNRKSKEKIKRLKKQNWCNNKWLTKIKRIRQKMKEINFIGLLNLRIRMCYHTYTRISSTKLLPTAKEMNKSSTWWKRSLEVLSKEAIQMNKNWQLS